MKYLKTLLVLSLLFQVEIYGANEIFNNGFFRFGNGTQPSINSKGNLLQPFSYIDGSWHKLTYSSYPLDMTWGVGGDGTNEWNNHGSLVTNANMSSQVIDNTGFTRTSGDVGYGTLIVKGNISVGGATLEVEHVYSLEAGADKGKYIKIITTVKNVGTSSVSNLRFWTGTGDDYMGTTDRTLKEKGNIVDLTFSAISNQSDQAQIIKVSSNSEGTLLYSTSNKTHTIVGARYGWTNYILPADPLNTPVSRDNDGSYALYVRMNDLAVGESESFTWYYAAAPLNELDDVIRSVGQSASAITGVTAREATLNTNSNVSGTGYWIAVAKGSTAPTASQIKAGTNYGSVTVVTKGSGAVQADEDVPFTISPLEPGTEYEVYFVVEDGSSQFFPITKAELETIDYSVVSTRAISEYTATSFTVGGTVSSNGDGEVSERGVVYSSTDTMPEIDSAGVIKKSNGIGVGEFLESIGGLSAKTTYYVRAYSINEAGVSYGDVITFTTNAVPRSENKILVTPEDASLLFMRSNFSFIDSDTIDTLVAIKITQLETVGELQLSGVAVTLNQVISSSDLGNLSYTPRVNENGSNYDNFAFKVSDGVVYSDTANTITISVTATNDAPSLVASIMDVEKEESSAAFDYINLNDVFDDIDGEALTYGINNNNTALVDVSLLPSGVLHITPVADSFGIATVIISASDSTGLTVSDTFTITIASTNVAPVAGGGAALEFNGVDEWAYIPQLGSSSSFSSAYTVEMWFRPDSTENSASAFVLKAEGSDDGGEHIMAEFNSNGSALRFLHRPNGGVSGGTNIYWGTTGQLTDGKWHHIALVYDPSDGVAEQKLIIDGVEVASINSDTPLNTSGNNESLVLGRLKVESNARNYKGQIEDLKIWSEARSVEELRIYQNKSPITEDNLVAYYPFNENEGSVLNDLATGAVGNLRVNDIDATPEQASNMWINGVEQPPITVTEDVPYNGYLKASDDDGDAISYIIVDQTNLHGTITFDGTTGGYTYTPELDYFGAAQISYQVSDPQNAISNIAILDISITSVNDAPVLDSGGVISVIEDETFSITLGNLFWHDADNTADDIEVVVLQGDHYTVSAGSNGHMNVVTPTANFNGVLSVKAIIRDNELESVDTASVTVNVTGVNDAPHYVAIEDTTTLEDTPIYLDRRIASYDNIDGDVGLFLLVLPPTLDEYAIEKIDTIITTELDGVTPLTIGHNASNASDLDTIFITYKVTPKRDTSGVITLRTRMSDPFNAVSDTTILLSLSVDAINDAPILQTSFLDQVVVEDASPITSLDLNSVFSDIENNDLTFDATTKSGNNLLITPTITSADSILLLTITPNANGVDTVIVRATDNGTPALTTSDTFEIQVTAVNDTPTIVTPLLDTTLLEDFDTLHYRKLTTIFTDEEEATSLQFSVVSLRSLVVPTIDSDSVLTLTSTLNANGVDTLIVTASDSGTPALSVQDTLVITVAAVNDAPVLDSAGTIAIQEDEVFSIHLGNLFWSDVDDGADSIDVLVQPGDNYLVTSGGNTVTPTANFNGVLSVKTIIRDRELESEDTVIVSVTVTGVNDAPNYIAIGDTTTLEDTPLYLDRRLASYNNIDGDVGLFLLVLPPVLDEYTIERVDTVITTELDGTTPLTIGHNATNSGDLDTIFVAYKVTPKLDTNGTIAIRTRMSDPYNAVSDTTIVLPLNVVAVNDAPILQTSFLDQVVAEDALPITSLDLNSVFSDIEQDALTFGVTTKSGNNLLVTPTIASADSVLHVSFTPNANGVDTLIVTATDNGTPALTTSDTFEIQVTAVNDAPIIVTPLVDTTLLEDFDTLHYRNLTTIFTDEEQGTSLHFSVVSLRSLVVPSIDSDSIVTLTSTLNANGVDTLIISASDSGTPALSVQDTLVITVAAVNDAPVLDSARTIAIQEDEVFSIHLGNLFWSDVDDSIDAIKVLVQSGENYTVSNDGNGNPTIVTPTSNYNGVLLVNVLIGDNSATSVDTAVVTVTVTGQNDAPSYSAVRDTTTIEDSAIYLDRRLAQYHNIDGDIGLFLLVLPATLDEYVVERIDTVITTELDGTTPLTIGHSAPNALDPDTIFVTYKVTPKLDTNGTIAIRTRMSDPYNAISSEVQTISLTVTAVNDAPVVVANGIPDIGIQEDFGEIYHNQVEPKFNDVDDAILSYSIQSLNTTPVVIPEIIENSPTNHSIKLTQIENKFGSDTLEVKALDATGAFALDTFILVVAPVNDVPTIVNAISDTTILEDFTTLNYRDLNTIFNDIEDGHSLTFSTMSFQNLVSLSIDNDSMLVVESKLNVYGIDTVVVSAADIEGLIVADTFILTITSVDDITILDSSSTISSIEDSTFTISVNQLYYTDIDTDLDSLNTVILPGNHYTVDANGHSITPESNFNSSIDGLLMVNVKMFNLADSANSLSNTLVVPVTITGENDGPNFTAVRDTFTNEDTPIILDRFLATYENIDLDTGLHLVVLPSATDAYTVREIDTIITTDHDGNVFYVNEDSNNKLDTMWTVYEVTPQANFYGDIKVAVRMRDPFEALSTQTDTITLTVHSVNDIPTVRDSLRDVAVLEDALVSTLSDLDNVFSDIEDNELSYGVITTSGTTNLVTPSIDGDNQLLLAYSANAFGVDTIIVTATDDDAAEVTDTIVVSVASRNDTPLITSPLLDTTITEDFAPIEYRNLTTTFNDIENGTHITYTVVSQSNIISPTINSDSTLVLTALSDKNGIDTLIVTAIDDSLAQIQDTLIITVNPINDSPVLVSSDTIHIFEDEHFTIEMGNVTWSDVDNTINDMSILLLPGDHYSVVGDSIIPQSNYPSDLAVNLQISDNESTNALSDTITTYIKVTAVNDAPNFKSVRDTSTAEDHPILLDRRLAEYDNIDLDLGLFLIVNSSTNNLYTIRVIDTVITEDLDGNTLYMTDSAKVEDTIWTAYEVIPQPNFNGSITVPVRMSDPFNAVSDIDSLTLTVLSVNDAPVLEDTIRDGSVLEDAAPITLVDLNDLFSDIDNDNLTFTTSTLSGGNTLITPHIDSDSVLSLQFTENSFGRDTILVTATDDSGATVIDTFSFTVTSVNDNPVVIAPISDTLMQEDFGTVAYRSLPLVFTDIENGTNLQYEVTSLASIVTPTVNVDSAIVLTAKQDMYGIDSIVVTATDEHSATITDTFVVQVAPVNDAPALVQCDTVHIFEDERFTLEIGGVEWSDVDNTISDMSVLLLPGAHYTISGDTIVPQHNYPSDLKVNVQVSDGYLVSDTVQAYVQVTAVNDAPNFIGVQDTTTNEDTPIILDRRLATYDNIDLDLGLFLIVNASVNNLYTIRVIDTVITEDFDGNTLYMTDSAKVEDTIWTAYEVTPKHNFNGVLALPVRMSDPFNAVSSIDTLKLTVQAVNDTPIVVLPLFDVSRQEDFTLINHVSLLSVFYDAEDLTALTYSVVAKQGIVNPTIDSDSNLLIHSILNMNGVDTLIITASDGLLSVLDTMIVHVDKVNDTPIINSAISDITTEEDFTSLLTSANLTQVFSDVEDGSQLSYSVVSVHHLINPRINSDSTLTFEAVADSFGIDTIIVTATDTGLLAVSDTIAVTIAAVDDAPVVNNTLSSITVDEDAPADTILLSNLFTDIDSDDTLIVKEVTGNSNSTIVSPVISGDTLILEYNAHQHGATTIEITGTIDGKSATTSMDITVTSVNDRPILTSITPQVTNEDTPFTLTLAMTDGFDVDDSMSSANLILQPGSNYTVVGQTITPNKDFYGELVIPVQLSDSILMSSPVNLSLMVKSVNDIVTIATEIEDIVVDEHRSQDKDDLEDSIVDLNSVYFDIEESNLLYDVISLDSTLVIPYINKKGILSVEYLEDVWGTTQIIVSIDDNDTIIYDTIGVLIERVAHDNDTLIDNDFGHVINPEVLQNVVIAPNPAPATATYITIRSNTKGADKIEIKILDALGTVVNSGDAEIGTEYAEYVWNISKVRSRLEGNSYVVFITYKKDGAIISQEKRMVGVRE